MRHELSGNILRTAGAIGASVALSGAGVEAAHANPSHPNQSVDVTGGALVSQYTQDGGNPSDLASPKTGAAKLVVRTMPHTGELKVTYADKAYDGAIGGTHTTGPQ